jgi:sigma-B regulation protein RsbU (phosphoserine phosphatase)
MQKDACLMHRFCRSMATVSAASQSLHVPTFRTVRARMLFWILIVTVPLYGGALYMSHGAAAHRLEVGAESDADELAARLATGMDAVIRPIEGGVRTVAYQLEEIDPPRAQYSQRILGLLHAWPEIYGSTIAVETERDPSAKPFAPYYFKRASEIGYSDLALDSYGYQQLPWYRLAADTKHPVWSAPYFDAGGGDIWMVTYSAPFYRRLPDAQRVLAGIVTADLDLNWVRNTVASVPLGPLGMGWLSSPPDGKSFVAPIGSTPTRIATFDAAMNADAIRAAGEAMLAKHITFALLPESISAKPAYLAVRHLETLEWRLMLVIPQSELLGEARNLLNRQLWLGAIGLIVLLVAIAIVAAGIARPIHALAVAVSRTSSDDDLSFQLPDAPRRDEIGVLTDALRRMRDSLKEHIRLRAQSLAEQARLDRELEIAASIQQSMLPRQDPAQLSRSVEIAAALLPAKQVGGDLYDYFPLSDGNLLFAIGDVSDKGIPAALFMARLSALLRVLGSNGEPPDRLLSAINSRLVDGNDACMFVTLGCGLLNLETGLVRYASAGHDSPLIRDAGGAVRPLTTEAEGGAAIGIEDSALYQLSEGYIAPGDTIVLFTDGATEAEAEDGSLWGIERLTTLLSQAPDNHPAALVKQIVDTVSAHTTGYHATDDLTVMAVRFNPPAVSVCVDAECVRWLMTVETSAAGTYQIQLWLHALLASRKIASTTIHHVELIAEELLTNIIRAASAEARSIRLTLECALTPTDIQLTVRDDSLEFNPLARTSPDLDKHVAERDIGGLGIHIVKELADDCSYARIDDWNVFEVRLERH